MQNYVVGGLIGYFVGIVVATLAHAAAAWMGRVAEDADRLAGHGRGADPLRLDAAPLAERRRLRLWPRVGDGLRPDTDVSAVPALRRFDARLGHCSTTVRPSCVDGDAAARERSAFVARLQREGRGIDELQIEDH
jgi:hypothetical protein